MTSGLVWDGEAAAPQQEVAGLVIYGGRAGSPCDVTELPGA